MSKLVFTTNSLLLDNYHQTAISGSYSITNRYNIGSCIVESYKKLCVDNTNFFNSNKGYVTAVGTYIYKGKTDSDALSMILDDFDGDIIALRDKILGNFLLMVYQDNNCYFCTDKNGLFDAFYYQNIDGTIAISNTLYELCKSIPHILIINELNVLEQVFQIAILGNDTIVDEIKRLRGYEYIKVNITKPQIEIVSILNTPEYCFDFTKDIDGHVKQFCNDYEQYVKTISDVFQNDIAISATGGLDARMVLSGFLKNKSYPVLYSGEGNSVLSTTRKMDTDIVAMIAKEFGLEQKILNWSTSDPVDKDWIKYIERYGFFAGIYGGSEDTMNSYESIKERFITHGFYGEMYRTVSFIQSYIGKESTITLDDYLDKYYIEKRIQSVISPQKYKLYYNNIKNKFAKLLMNYGLEAEHLTADFCQALIFEYRRNADSRFVNFCNRQRYSIAIIGERELLRHTFLPIAIKADATFIIRAINNMESKLLDFPLYSTNKVDYINKEKLIMEVKTPVGDNLIRTTLRKYMQYPWVQKLYFKLSIMKKYLVHDKKVASEQKESKILSKQINNIIKENSLFDHSIDASSSNDMSRMSRYAIMMLILKSIKTKA